jgi:putative CRISPR-associated protein (TIGR02619 family)
MTKPSILLCTVGTSLFRPNLEGLIKDLAVGSVRPELRPLAEAYQAKDWPTVSRELARLPPSERLCGAEINSIASMIDKGYVPRDCGLFFLHSDTDDGRSTAAVLQTYFQVAGHGPVEAVEVPDLQDQDAKRFRTKGLRNLARKLCAVLRERSAPACAINATGGYKAQIAIAVLLGQALGVPVYYKHELFSEIIAFPPMPIAMDFEVWMRASDMLFDLAEHDLTPADDYLDEWDERYEALVEHEEVDGVGMLALSPTGQIFHETFHQRFQSHRDQILPPAVPPRQKQRPRLKEDEGHLFKYRDEVMRFMQQVTDEVEQVKQCTVFYFNPDLPKRTGFRLGSKGIEGIFSNGSYCVKFSVDTSAVTEGQKAAVKAALNEWLADQV